MMDYIIDRIVAKWGYMEEGEGFVSNGHPVYMDNGLRFNYVFAPENMESYEECAVAIGFELPAELKKLYQQCNGVRLFLSSFSIYGLQKRSEEMEPFDLTIENLNICSRMRENQCNPDGFFFFGAYGRNYVFAYKDNDPNRIFCLKNGYDTVELEFGSLQELFEYFIPRIIVRYDEECKKDKPYERFKMVPVLANAMYELDEIKDYE